MHFLNSVLLYWLSKCKVLEILESSVLQYLSYRLSYYYFVTLWL